MKNKLLGGVLTAAILWSFAFGQAEAHGIWLAQRAGQLALVYGVGNEDLNLVRRIQTIEGVAAYDANFQPIDAGLRVAGPMVLVDADEQPTIVTAILQNGVFARMNGGEWERKTRAEWPEADQVERTIKFAVSIQGPLSGQIPPLPGQVLQIIPQADIPEMKGMSLKYQVLLDGKPAEGAKVIADMVGDPDATPVESDAYGMVELPVRNQGLNVVRATMYGSSPEPDLYTRIEHTATITYTLAHLPE